MKTQIKLKIESEYDTKWVRFPLQKGENSAKAFKALDLKNSDGYRIVGVEFFDHQKSARALFHAKNLHEVNYFAHLYEALSDDEKWIYRAMTESSCIETETVADLIRFLLAMDEYFCIAAWCGSKTKHIDAPLRIPDRFKVRL